MWYAGIEWAADHHDAVVLDADGHQVTVLRMSHTRAGVAELTQALEQISGGAAKDQLASPFQVTFDKTDVRVCQIGMAELYCSVSHIALTGKEARWRSHTN